MDVSPPWGAFPVKQYLIRYWDNSSALSTKDQRRDLVRKFLQLDGIPRDWDATFDDTTIARVPTELERSNFGDVAAMREVWLRTHYAEDSFDKFNELRESAEDNDRAFEEVCRSWTVLDDSAVFKGSWLAALDLLPELAGPIPASALRLEGRGNDAEQLKVAEVEVGPAGKELQAHVASSFLFVVDTEAFETGSLRLLFLDVRGNIVREARVPSTDTWEMREAWNAKKFRTGSVWADRRRSEWGQPNSPGSVLGDSYKFSDDIGRVLYGLEYGNATEDI
ncbi:putative WW domain-containing protein [Seiridium unicorne]|uniref:WW domain-containing protein n=1 Tax=Seiridium unicorne TaxID=138068 RepID=A0ABR2UUM4_9PEZI